MPLRPLLMAALLPLALGACTRTAAPGAAPASAPDAAPAPGAAPAASDSGSTLAPGAAPLPDPSDDPDAPAPVVPGMAMDEGFDESATIVPNDPQAMSADRTPMYAARMGQSVPGFVGFVRANMGKTVRLELSFEPVDDGFGGDANAPYDYRGGEGLALWYTHAGPGGEGAATGFFFDCAGSFDRRTGYARRGTVEGLWRVDKVQRLGGDPHYTLSCVE